MPSRGTRRRTDQCDLEVDRDVLIRAGDQRLLVSRVNPVPRSPLADLLQPDAPLRLGVATRWRPRWRDTSLIGVDLRARVPTPTAIELHVHFALPARERTLARLPTHIVLLDLARWQVFERSRCLRRGIVLPAGSPDLLRELLDIQAASR